MFNRLHTSSLIALSASVVLNAAAGLSPALGQTQTEVAKLLATDGEEWDEFGFPVAVWGNTAVIGARHDDDSGEDSGSAYVFRFDGAAWVQEAKLLASDGATDDWFGGCVAIDGDIVVTSARGDDDNGSESGSVYVFMKPSDGWANMSETAKLTCSDGAGGDHFGVSLAICGDTILVGATGDDDSGNQSGAAYVFMKPSDGWAHMTETAKLTADDGATADFFGSAVAISGDTCVIGATGDDCIGSRCGSAYVFDKPEGGWVDMTETAKLIASDVANEWYFGCSVAVFNDTVIIGADLADGHEVHSGAAYVFEKPPGGWTNMTETTKLTADDGAYGDGFGLSVSIWEDTAVIGAYGDTDNGFLSGSAYVFQRRGSIWIEKAKLLPSDGAEADFFGVSVAISGQTVVVGARYANITGAGYVFEVYVPGDCNGDGNVDLDDFVAFQICFTGTGGPVAPGCECVDFDGDDDVDLQDFLAFQTAYTGPG